MKQTFTSFLLFCFCCSFLYGQEEMKIHDLHCRYQVKNGRLHGAYLSTYANGCTRAEGKFKNNQRDSTWVLYDTCGEVMAKRHYENGWPCPSFVPFEKISCKKDSSTKETLLDGVYIREHASRYRCIPYSYLKQPDLSWIKRVWRFIGDEKNNRPLFARKALAWAILSPLADGNMAAYQDQQGEWGDPLAFSSLDTVQHPIIGFLLKEDWYFDHARSLLDVQLQGLAPAILDPGTGDTIALCWFYFPDLVPVLKEQPSFLKHGAPDDLYTVFYKRLFSSQALQQTTVYNNSWQQVPGCVRNTAREKNFLEMIEKEHDHWSRSY